jgi:acyl-CoA thioester hydrolase
MFEYHLTARGYELDSYNHVNNAVFLNYMEQARWEIMQEKGILDSYQEEGKKLVVTEINIRYAREIKLFDEIVVITEIKKKAPYLIFQHKIVNKKKDTLCAKATVKTLLLDNENLPMDIPEDLLKLTKKG